MTTSEFDEGADDGPTSRSSAAVKSASRAIDILEFVARASKPPSFLEISQQLEIPKSSLSMLLTTLIGRGYLEQPEARGGYKLGLGARRLAVEFDQGATVSEQVAPLLDRLARNLQETCGYYEARGDYVECIESCAYEQVLVYKMFVGERVHMYANSCGKAILAQLPDDQLKAYIARTEFRAYTDRTISSAPQLLREIEEIRKTGIGRTFGEYYPGIAALAVALVEGGKVLGAVNVGLPMVRLNTETEELIKTQLRLFASHFSQSVRGPDLGLRHPT
jgi:IclR family acetate operon transcriptional repressor